MQKQETTFVREGKTSVITSVLLTRQEFDELCDELVKSKPLFEENIEGQTLVRPISEATIAKIREAGYIRLLSRGTNTQDIFTKFKIHDSCNLISVAVQ